MADTSEYQFRVGLFVTLGIIVILTSLFILGGSKTTFTKMVELHTKLDNAQGLYAGSIVSFTGITVGNIDAVEFIPSENLLDIKLKIDSTFLPKMMNDSTVEVRTQGALGDKYLFISPGKPGGTPLKEGDSIKAAQATDLMGVLAERSGEATKIFDIISETHKVLKSLNDNNRAERIFSNLATATDQFSQLSKESHQILEEIHKQGSPKFNSAMEKLDRILGKVDSGEGTLGALINDSSIHDQIKTMVGGSSRKKSIKTLLRNSVDHTSPDHQ